MEEKLLSHYKKDREGRYIVDVLISDIKRFFDEFDPSPINAKYLNKKLVNSILEHIVIFPKYAQVKLMIHLSKKLKNVQFEKKLESAIRRHFEHSLLKSQVHLKRRLMKGTKILLLSSVFFFNICFNCYYAKVIQFKRFFCPALYQRDFL